MTPQGAKSACVSCVKWEKRRGARTWLAFGRNKTRTFHCLRFKTSDYWQKSNACFCFCFLKKGLKDEIFQEVFHLCKGFCCSTMSFWIYASHADFLDKSIERRMFSLVSYVISFRITLPPNSNFQRKPNLTKKLIDFDSLEVNKSRWHSFVLLSYLIHFYIQ